MITVDWLCTVQTLVGVMKALSGLLMESLSRKEGWRYAVMECGLVCVTTPGVELKPTWCANKWDILIEVFIQHYCISCVSFV